MAKTGMSSFIYLFGEPPRWLDFIIYNILNFISVLGSILLFYCLIYFFIECFKYMKQK